MKAPIDLYIAGDTSAIYGLGSWAGDDAGSAVDEIVNQLRKLQSDAGYAWDGESFRAFQTAADVHRSELKKVVDYLSDAKELFEAYADRIARGRGYFADYASAAQAAGMVVAGGRFIQPPVRPIEMDCATPELEALFASRMRDYKSAVLLFQEIDGHVRGWHDDTDEWIENQFAPLLERLGEFGKLRGLLDYFELNAGTVVGALLSSGTETVERRLGDFREKQDELTKRDQERRKDQRSNDPARHNLYEQDERRANRTALDKVAKQASWLDASSKALRVAGPVAEVIGAGVAIAGGESASTTVVGAAGGLATAASFARVGGAGGLVFGGPVGAAVGAGAGALLGALSGSGLSKFLWEDWVPLKVRDAIDEGLAVEVAGQYRLLSDTLDVTRQGSY